MPIVFSPVTKGMYSLKVSDESKWLSFPYYMNSKIKHPNILFFTSSTVYRNEERDLQMVKVFFFFFLPHFTSYILINARR